MSVAAILLAAGKGTRAGGSLPKQIANLAGRPVAEWSLRTFIDFAGVDQIVLVFPPDLSALPTEAQRRFELLIKLGKACGKNVHIVTGGETRAASVRNALAALTDTPTDFVLIHDSARPGLSETVLQRLMDTLPNVDGVAPALPVVDALKRAETGNFRNVSREGLYRVQTPQGFRFNAIYTALNAENTAFVDDLEAIEAAGGLITLIEGEERLSKLTYGEDFAMLERHFTGAQKPPRAGTGYDVHAFEDGNAVTLCGVDIPHTAKLKGHSDADVAWHALTDAILGALALGDIGDHFPPSEAKWKGAPSRVFLEFAASKMRESGYQLANADLTLICEAPKVKPHRLPMREATAACLGVPLDRVSVKATTTEELGFTGRREGIACMASVMLVPT